MAGDVPESLKNTSLISLDLGLLQAGASVKGEFEKRLKNLIAEIKSAPNPIILFIDEAHTLIGAGNQEGSSDAANLLKPSLARGELRTIAATTWKEYKKYLEKDPALSRRFQLIKIHAPNEAQAIEIMRGLHQTYEQTHQVMITDEALKSAVSLSARYLSGRQLPDKAIDVLDTACARIAIHQTCLPGALKDIEIRQLARQRKQQLLEREALFSEADHQTTLAEIREQNAQDLQAKTLLTAQWKYQQNLVDQMISLRQQLMSNDAAEGLGEKDLQSLRAKLQAVTAEFNSIPAEDKLISPQVDREQIAHVISDWTGIPVSQMTGNELKRLTQLPQIIADRIQGQDLAIQTIHRHLLTSSADLRRAGRPKGAFLLVGPSGVGKTETVVQIAEHLYGSKTFLITINMSEYQEKHTVSRLIGAPAGYVGFGEGAYSHRSDPLPALFCGFIR